MTMTVNDCHINTNILDTKAIYLNKTQHESEAIYLNKTQHKSILMQDSIHKCNNNTNGKLIVANTEEIIC